MMISKYRGGIFESQIEPFKT
uniref:Uncharacterized protein n=1 Tax=Rhizophora mucronata TaxID=61149 RepID=A0A2P2R3Z2_RHIMU